MERMKSKIQNHKKPMFKFQVNKGSKFSFLIQTN